MARADLARAEQALADPPLDDFARLVELAPLTLDSRGLRVGLALVNPLNLRTPHATHVLAALMRHMMANGLWVLVQEYWLSYIKGKVDPKTYARVARVFEPAEPDPYQPEQPTLDQARADLRAPVGRDRDLPAYGSPEAQRIRRAETRYRGPASWPSYGGVRAPGH
jgi:hypothetical protein